MGYYINPNNMTKEQWLMENGRVIREWSEIHEEEYPVCLVDNGIFTAAGIAYDRGEATAFAKPDGRLKTWFAVKRNKLIEVEPSVTRVLENPF